jgi:hypothetical protein
LKGGPSSLVGAPYNDVKGADAGLTYILDAP